MMVTIVRTVVIVIVVIMVKIVITVVIVIIVIIAITLNITFIFFCLEDPCVSTRQNWVMFALKPMYSTKSQKAI